MRNKLIALICFALLSVVGFVLHSQSVAGNETKEVMRFKLHYAQGVLEGITMENFDLIATNALKLKNLSQQANWQIRQTPEYQRLTMQYAQNADALGKAAKDKNVDAATVAYFQMTVSCTTCHKYLRGAKSASLEQEKNIGTRD